MHIGFVDLERQNRIHRKEFTKALTDILKSASFIGGHPLETFEREFAQACGRKYCIGLNSGTDALWLTLHALGIGPGDEVITTPFTYFSTAMVISTVGAKPVFVDVDYTSRTIDVTKIESAVTKRTRAIIPVHLYGQSADMDPIVKIARKHKLFILEDCCQAVNARYKGKKLPVTGTGAFSFYPGKNLGAFGDGGAVVTDDKKLADRLIRLRNDGSAVKYVHTIFGYKSRLDNIQASILSAKLPYLNEWTNLRRHWANRYRQLLSNLTQIRIPKEMPYARHVYHCYAIECNNRDRLHTHLTRRGIVTVIHYPTPIHLQKPYRDMGYRTGRFPVSEKLCKTVLSLPMFPELTQKEVEYICHTIKKFYANAH